MGENISLVLIFIGICGIILVSLPVAASPPVTNTPTPNQTITPDSASLQLYHGWNFISVQENLEPGSDTFSIFSTVDSAGHSIWEYDGYNQSWIIKYPGDPVKVLYGYWIYSNSSITIQLQFSHDPYLVLFPRNLSSGWNIIGFAGNDVASARDTLFSVSNSWTQAMGFDAQTQTYEPQIVNGGDGSFSDSRPLVPNKGYWLYMTNPGWLPGAYPLYLNASVPSFPGNIMVYQTIHEDPMKKISHLARIFNITGNVTTDANFAIIRDQNQEPELMVMINSSEYEYKDNARWMGSDPRDSPELVPSDENATRIAEDYLKSKGLWPDDAVFGAIGYGTGGNSDGGVFHKQVEVGFKHIINSLVVNREGITVSVGGGDDIIGVRGIWRNCTPYKEFPLITPTEAFEELKKNNKTGIISRISLEYDAGDPWEDPGVLIPVYLFEGTDYDAFSGPFTVRYYVTATPSLNKNGLAVI